MAARNNGSKIVFASVTMILATLGVGTVYLPFFADKMKIRGLHEEGEMSSSERREYEQALRQMGMTTPEQGQSGMEEKPALSNGMRHSNSMWARMNQASGK